MSVVKESVPAREEENTIEHYILDGSHFTQLRFPVYPSLPYLLSSILANGV